MVGREIARGHFDLPGSRRQSDLAGVSTGISGMTAGVPIRWTSEEDAVILAARKSGVSLAKVSLQLGKNRTTVGDRSRALNAGNLAPHPRFFTPDEDAIILRMVSEGESYRSISEATGRAYSSIFNRVAYLERNGAAVAKPRNEAATAARKPEKQHPQRSTNSAMVRCLGGCGRMFLSADKFRNRQCKTCRERNSNSGLPGDYSTHI